MSWESKARGKSRPAKRGRRPSKPTPRGARPRTPPAARQKQAARTDQSRSQTARANQPRSQTARADQPRSQTARDDQARSQPPRANQPPRPRPPRPARREQRPAPREIPPGSAAARALPRVVIAGRPNAGKSSLFNRLLRRRKAVVDPTPGVTRDVNEAVAVFDDRAVLLVDTGGFEGDASGPALERAVRDVSLAAVGDAALVLYVLDGKAGLSPADETAAAELRRRRARVLFVVNKVDAAGRLAAGHEFYRLGADEIVPISAAHGHGVADLVDRMLAIVPANPVPADAAERSPGDDAIRVAIVGRPNAGKSSLLNRLLGYQRALVDPTAGTTRDALDTLLEVGGTRYVLVDTAGIRRKSRVSDALERSSIGSAIEALGRADVAVLVIDAVEGLTGQDQRLAALAWNEGRGLVLVVNKWDLKRDEKPKTYLDEVMRQMPTLGGFPMLTISAKSGVGVDAVLPAVKKVAAAHAAELKTARLNEVVADAVRTTPPPTVGGRHPRIYYATQTARRPPTIAVFTSAPGSIHPSYHRYLANKIADAFHLKGTPLRIGFRARH